jgi:hypothetical protein
MVFYAKTDILNLTNLEIMDCNLLSIAESVIKSLNLLFTTDFNGRCI